MAADTCCLISFFFKAGRWSFVPSLAQGRLKTVLSAESIVNERALECFHRDANPKPAADGFANNARPTTVTQSALTPNATTDLSRLNADC